jgi:hypothetical protein
MHVAIVILNWNGKKLLEKFLPTILHNLPSYADVYVIDNASSDDSVNFILTNFPSVRIVFNQCNFGFAKGYNEGLKKINADYFVLLNSDVEVTANWIEPIISLMEKDMTIAACQPKLLNYNVRDEFEYAGGAGGFIDKFGYPFCRGRIFNSFEKDKGQYDDTREIFWASGACLFIRAEKYFEVGGLDEDFFAHQEEIDLCWRLRNMGYKIMYCSDSKVYHIGAGTLAKVNPQKTFFNFRNNLLLLCKNHATKFFFTKLFLRGILDGIAALKFLFSGNLLHSFAVVKAHFSFYSLLPKMLRKRKELRKNIKPCPSSDGCVYNGSIVWQYFARGKRKFSELGM